MESTSKLVTKRKKHRSKSLEELEISSLNTKKKNSIGKSNSTGVVGVVIKEKVESFPPIIPENRRDSIKVIETKEGIIFFSFFSIFFFFHFFFILNFF